MVDLGFRNISIIGMGLMGSSLGKALVKFCPCTRVTGIVRREEAVGQVVAQKAAHICTLSLADGLKDADLVVLSMPVEVICRFAGKIAPYLKAGCVVTDMGSTKKQIVDTVSATLAGKAVFIGSHPMAGSEKTGLDNAYPELFEGSVCIITPEKNIDKALTARLSRFWQNVGCRIKYIPPDEHDLLIAAVSHVPYLVASALVNFAGDIQSDNVRALDVATPLFKQTTRVASGSPQMWRDICLSNKTHILAVMQKLEENIKFVRETLLDEDEQAIKAYLHKAKSARDNLSIGNKNF